MTLRQRLTRFIKLLAVGWLVLGYISLITVAFSFMNTKSNLGFPIGILLILFILIVGPHPIRKLLERKKNEKVISDSASGSGNTV